jgi:hypothetical protein
VATNIGDIDAEFVGDVRIVDRSRGLEAMSLIEQEKDGGAEVLAHGSGITEDTSVA